MGGRVFLYHAHGFALGGTITKPFKAELDSHAATTLPVVGGYASAKSENFRFKEMVSFKSAHTYISGIRNDDGVHSTVVNTLIEGLNILDVITADAIIGRLSSKHVDGKEPEIIPLGSSFENLRIAGQPVEIDLDNDLFLKYPTYSALQTHFTGPDHTAEYQAKKKPRYLWQRDSEDLPPELEKGMMVPPDTGYHDTKGVLHNSMVKQVRLSGKAGEAEERTYGYAIRIPQVGRLYLGEVFTSADTKRLSMLRLELGSPVTGTLAAAGPVSNGSWYP